MVIVIFHIFLLKTIVKFILGHENITKLLIDTGADVNAKTRIGFTPLHSAARNGNFSSNFSILNVNSKSSTELFIELFDLCR